MDCSAAFGLLKITLHVTKQEDLKGASRPNRLFGDSWSAENHFARNKTGGFARLEQTKWAIFLHLVCFFAKKATESRRSAHKKTPHSQGAGRISRVFAKSATKQPSRLRRPWRMLPDRRRRDTTACSLHREPRPPVFRMLSPPRLVNTSRSGSRTRPSGSILGKASPETPHSRLHRQLTPGDSGSLMALPTGAHSNKKRPALLQAERNFSRFR